MFSLADFVQAQNTGSVCIAKFNAPASGQKTLGNPTGGDSFHEYKIQIGDKTAFGSYDEGVKISGLSVRKKYFLKIFRDGDLVQSFGFRFDDKLKNLKYCLWLKDLYQTWQLWEAGKSSACSCK